MRRIFFFLFFMIILLPSFGQKTFPLNIDPDCEILRLRTNGDDYALVYRTVHQGILTKIVEYYVLTKDKKYGPFDELWNLNYYKKYKTYIFNVEIDGKSYLYFGDERQGPFDSCFFYLSTDGNSGAYYFQKNNERMLYLNKKLIGTYEDIDECHFAPNAISFIYTFKTKGKWYINNSKSIVGPFDEVERLTFSPDGKKVAYYYKQNKQWYIFTGIEKYGPFDEFSCTALAFTPDSKILAYTGDITDKTYVFAGKEKVGPYNSANQLTFSQDGRILIYSVLSDNGWYIYSSNEIIGGPYQYGPISFSFSTDNSSFACFIYGKPVEALNAGYYLYLNNEAKAGPFYSNIWIESFLGNDLISYVSGKYSIENDKTDYYTKVLISGQEYIGSIYNKDYVSLDSNGIVIRKYSE